MSQWRSVLPFRTPLPPSAGKHEAPDEGPTWHKYCEWDGDGVAQKADEFVTSRCAGTERWAKRVQADQHVPAEQLCFSIKRYTLQLRFFRYWLGKQEGDRRQDEN